MLLVSGTFYWVWPIFRYFEYVVNLSTPVIFLVSSVVIFPIPYASRKRSAIHLINNSKANNTNDDNKSYPSIKSRQELLVRDDIQLWPTPKPTLCPRWFSCGLLPWFSLHSLWVACGFNTPPSQCVTLAFILNFSLRSLRFRVFRHTHNPLPFPHRA